MARIKITGPDGKTVILNAPEGATPEQINAKVAQIKQQWGSFEQTNDAPEKPTVGRLESLGRGALQGLTLGFSDELYGAGAGALDYLQGEGFNYAKNRDEVRAANAKAQEANPGTYLMGEIGAGIAMPFGAARAATRAPSVVSSFARTAGLTPELSKAATFGQRVGTGARTGATYGALYGAGTSEADTAEGVAQDTALGGLGGALFGGATVPAVDALAAVGRGVTAPIRARMKPIAFAQEQQAQALQRDMKGGQRLENRADIMSRSDPDTMIADVGGRSSQRLLRSAQNQQNPLNEPLMLRLDQRKRFEGAKLERGLKDGLKLSDDDLYASTDELAAKMDDIGSKVIEPTMAVETPITPRLKNVLARPKVQELVRRAEESLKNEDLPVGLDTRTRMLHRVKVLLDDELESLNEIIKSPLMADRTAKTDFRELTIIKNDLLNAIDNPAYKKALATYATPARVRSAGIKAKNEFLNKPWQEVQKDIARLKSDAERAMYRHGAAQAVIEQIGKGNAMNDKVRGVLSSDNMMGRLRQLFPDQKEWRTFQKLAVTLAKQNKTRQAVQGNSTTAQQLADMVDSGNVTEGVKQAANAATGNWRAVLDAAGRAGSRAMGMTPRVAQEIIRLQMMKPAAASKGFINTPSNELNQALAKILMGQQRRNAFSQGVISGGTAGTFTPLRGSMSGKEDR